MTIELVGLFSLLEITNSTFLNGSFSVLLSNVPLQNKGFGWVIPGLLGFTIGSIFEKVKYKEDNTVKKSV